MDILLPLHKLSLAATSQDAISDSVTKDQICIVLVATGSFNPPTYMHLRMFERAPQTGFLMVVMQLLQQWKEQAPQTGFSDGSHAIALTMDPSVSELARDALNSDGYCVLGGYMSPVNDAYTKRGLVSAEHRIQMCDLACKSSSFVMVDPWEANQSSYQRTLTVLARIQSFICERRLIPKESFKVMLVCGSDLLESFSIPGVWIREQVRSICRDYGVVCIRREGKDIDRIISSHDILNENKSNIRVVDELVPNQISSTRVRDCISRGLSVKYLTADGVIDYIKQQSLYLDSTDK